MYDLPKIDVHGMTSREAISLIQLSLPGFYNRGFPDVFIIHGNGQGILKKNIRNLLSGTYYVKSHRSGKPDEGGDGVTVAVFR